MVSNDAVDSVQKAMIPSDDNEPISVSDLYGNRESLQILNSLSGQFKDSLAADKPSQFQLFISEKSHA